MGGVDRARVAPAVFCGLLLTLPRQLEAAFWKHDGTLQAYTSWDKSVCIQTLLGVVISVHMLRSILFDPAVFAATWHLPLELALTAVTSTAIWALLAWWPATYRRHRHAIITANRLWRLAWMALSAAITTPETLRLLSQLLARRPLELGDSYAHVLHGVGKQLMLPAIKGWGHGGWVFPVRWWLPVQLLNYGLAIFGTQRLQACSMAANPFGGLLLQPTCKALTQLHQLVFGSLLGTLFLSATGYSTADELCHDMPSAARLLVWHAWAVQSVLVPALTMFHLEWRLKRKFVRTHCGSELRLSPAWLRPLPAARRWSGATHHTQQHSAGCAWGRLQAAVVRPVMLVPLLGLLWSVLVLVLRRLPMAPCETCADTGTCVRAAPCEGVLCAMPGGTLLGFICGQYAFGCLFSTLWLAMVV